MASGDDSAWKPLNYQICLKTRHSSPKVGTCYKYIKNIQSRGVPLLGKLFEIDHENPLHRKQIFEIDSENPRFRGNYPLLQNLRNRKCQNS
jgi:hypothetical protein